MKTLYFKDFMKKYNLKKDTRNESDLQEFVIIKFTPGVLK